MTWVLVLTVMLWTGNGTYESKHVEFVYGSEQACQQAKEEALAKVGDKEGAIARCVQKSA